MSTTRSLLIEALRWIEDLADCGPREYEADAFILRARGLFSHRPRPTATAYTQGIADARKAVETARTPFFPGCPEAEGVSAMRKAALTAIDAIESKETV